MTRVLSRAQGEEGGKRRDKLSCQWLESVFATLLESLELKNVKMMKSTEEDIEAKVKAIDTKQYYQLNPYERLQDDEDEDVETVNHRYDTSNDVTFEQAKSLAEEIREESEKNTTTRLEPPPDLLVSSNLRYWKNSGHKIEFQR